MQVFLEALNHPQEAFQRKDGKLAWILVSLTIFVVTIFRHLLSYLVYYGTEIKYEINGISILKCTFNGFLTYGGICVAFWLVGKVFGSSTGLKRYLFTWGLSYFPTLLCALVVVFVETYYYIFWNNSIWGLLANIVFVGILIWKTILYVIFLKEVAKLEKGKLVGAFFVNGIFIIAIAMLDMMQLDLPTPIL